MGWTGHYTNRPAEEVVREELSYNGYNTIVANRGAKYWVLERDGERFAVVVLVNRRDGMVYTKVMTEDMGPYDHAFPLAFLDLLSPTDSEFALNWRERVRTHHAKKKGAPKLAKGDLVVFSAPIEFQGDFSLTRMVFLGGYRFRGVTDYGQTVTVRLSKNWRTAYQWTVETPALATA